MNPVRFKIDEHRREFRRVRDAAVGRAPFVAQRIESLVADRVVVRALVARVRLGERIERVGNRIRRVAHRFVAADEIGIRVDEDRRMSAQPTRGIQVEEHGAASEEGLDVAAERRWIEPAELREQLPLAARPFQQRADTGVGDLVIAVIW